MNNQQQTKKPFDRKQFEADLDAFGTILRERTWSFDTANYADYLVALREEAELHNRAEKLGKYGVDEFRLMQTYAMGEKFRAEANQDAKRWIDSAEKQRDSAREELKALKERFYTPVDWYKERDLVSHDWYYDYSDDPNTYRRGKASETKLIQTAKEKGKEFQDALVAKWNEQYKRTDTTWSQLEAKLPYQPAPVVNPSTQGTPVFPPKSGEPVDLDKPFPSAKDYAQDPEKAKAYVASRADDYAKFNDELFAWTFGRPTATIPASVLNELREHGNVTYNGEVVRFASYDCFAAWFLARFW